MGKSISERDWKYLRKIQPEMLSALCERINRQAMAILQAEDISAHETYKNLYQHMKKSDKIVADCFDDWRRSNIRLKIPLLRRHGLLTDAQLNHMSDEIKDLLEKINQLQDYKSYSTS